MNPIKNALQLDYAGRGRFSGFKLGLFGLIWVVMCSSWFLGHSQDINFTNKVVSFTNLQGKLFKNVQLNHGDWDGVIWRDDLSEGRVCYTNLHPDLLEIWGIPTNRIGVARVRAERRAIATTRERAAGQIRTQAEILAKEKAEALESEAAPLRARAEQLKADTDAIRLLETQIENAKTRLRRAEAVARDHNRANLHNRLAPKLYVKDIERVKVKEAEARLKRMKAEFALKYKAHK